MPNDETWAPPTRERPLYTDTLQWENSLPRWNALAQNNPNYYFCCFSVFIISFSVCAGRKQYIVELSWVFWSPFIAYVQIMCMHYYYILDTVDDEMALVMSCSLHQHTKHSLSRSVYLVRAPSLTILFAYSHKDERQTLMILPHIGHYCWARMRTKYV